MARRLADKVLAAIVKPPLKLMGDFVYAINEGCVCVCVCESGGREPSNYSKCIVHFTRSIHREVVIHCVLIIKRPV